MPGAHHGDPRVAEGGREVDRGRRALDEQRDRQQREAADDQLPGHERDHVDGRGPPLDQDEAEGAHGHRPEGAGEAEGGHAVGVAQHQQGDAHEADEGRGDPDPGGALADHRPGQGHHGQRRRRLDRGREPARQVVGRQEDQREEGPDVEQAEDHGLPPPVAAGSCRRQASSTRPTGRARTSAAKSGRSGGRNFSVMMYVEPHAAGATAVSRTMPNRCPRSPREYFPRKRPYLPWKVTSTA